VIHNDDLSIEQLHAELRELWSLWWPGLPIAA